MNTAITPNIIVDITIILTILTITMPPTPASSSQVQTHDCSKGCAGCELWIDYYHSRDWKILSFAMFVATGIGYAVTTRCTCT